MKHTRYIYYRLLEDRDLLCFLDFLLTKDSDILSFRRSRSLSFPLCFLDFFAFFILSLLLERLRFLFFLLLLSLSDESLCPSFDFFVLCSLSFFLRFLFLSNISESLSSLLLK